MAVSLHEGYLPGCVGRITQLHAQFYARSNGFGVAFESKVARELAAFCAGFRPGRDGLWLAVDDDIQGSIAIVAGEADPGRAALRWFITSDALRGRGVGRALLGQALAFADARGVGTITLSTFAGLDAARHLYEAAGFRLVHEAPGATWGTVVQEQVFERSGA